MIFLAWFFYWITIASAPTHLLLPAVALVIRFSYIEKRFPTFPVLVIAFWLFLAAFQALENSITDAGVLLGQIALSTVCLFHFLSRLRKSRLRTVSGIGHLWFFMSRALVLLRRRVRDVRYWASVHWRSSESKLKDTFRIAKEAGIAFILEAIRIRKRFEAVIEARGRRPEELDWLQEMETKGAWKYAALGDLVIASVVLVPAVVQVRVLVPAEILSVVKILTEGLQL